MVRCAVLLFVLGLSQVGHSQSWKGIDASFLPEMLYDGVVYRDQEGAEIESPRQWMAEQVETSSEGSHWENAALFDFDWQALPTWDVFGGP